MIKIIASKKLIQTFQRLLKYLGFAFIIWLFGLLILIPLADYFTIVKSLVSLIILIPVGFLFFRSIKDMKIFSQIVGRALYFKYKKAENSKPYIHLLYVWWIMIGIVLFFPLIFIINKVIGGIFLFVTLIALFFIIFLNLKYIIAGMLRYLYSYKQD